MRTNDAAWLLVVAVVAGINYVIGNVTGYQDGRRHERAVVQQCIDEGMQVIAPNGEEIQRWGE